MVVGVFGEGGLRRFEEGSDFRSRVGGTDLDRSDSKDLPMEDSLSIRPNDFRNNPSHQGPDDPGWGRSLERKSLACVKPKPG